MPLPSHLDLTTRAPTFVGRTDELDALTQARKEVAAHGQRRLVLVGGEPGIGKTTLAGVFGRAAHADGSVVLYGRCDEELRVPFRPWAEVLAHLIEHAPAGLVDEVVRANGAVLARLGPALGHLAVGGAGDSSDPETARYLLFRAVGRVLRTAARLQPVVVVLDDVQWADPPTLQLLRHMVVGDGALPVLVIATFRESEVGVGNPLADLLADLHRESGVERLSMTGLGADELLDLLQSGTEAVIGTDAVVLRDALRRETDGNPFFVGELMRHLIETGGVFQDDHGRWGVRGNLLTGGLPASVREVIGGRVARLGPQAVRVLTVAAVIGGEFDMEVLASATHTDPDAVLDILDSAVAATLVAHVPGNQYGFAHALVGHALYGALAPARQARLHHQVAGAIERLCGDDAGPRVGELAYHYAKATAPEAEAKAIVYAAAAGRRALAQLSPIDALRWYDQALGLLDHRPADDERLRGALLAGLGDVQRQAGDPGFRETLLTAGRMAQRAGDAETLIAAALANNRGGYSAAGQVDTELVAMIEAALQATGPGDNPVRARLLSLLALQQVWDGEYGRRRVIADEALAMARRVGDPATVLEVLLRRDFTIWVPGSLADRLADGTETEALADRVGDPMGRFLASTHRMRSAIETADLGRYQQCVDVQSELATEVGNPHMRWQSTLSRSVRALLAGDANAAEALADQFFKMGLEDEQPDAVILFAGLLRGIRWHQGRLGELMTMPGAIKDEKIEMPLVRAAVASIYANRGRSDQALALLDTEAGDGFTHAVDLLQLAGLLTWAETAAHLGHVVAAEMLTDRLTPWADQIGVDITAVYGAAAHYLGHLATVLGRYDAAEAHFAQALEQHERLQAPFHVARTRLEWGRMLLRRARRQDARDHLEAAHDTAERFGCAQVQQRAASLLREA